MQMAAALEQRKIKANHAHHAANAFIGSMSSDAQSSRDDHGARSAAWDDSETVLSLAEHLASSRQQKARTFAANLYQTIFRYNLNLFDNVLYFSVY